jgi:hypothetical protein
MAIGWPAIDQRARGALRAGGTAAATWATEEFERWATEEFEKQSGHSLPEDCRRFLLEIDAVIIQSVGTWTIVIFTMSSDEAVIALSEALGIGATEVVNGVGRWWRRATAERDQGALRVVIAGPHHLDLPP